MKKVIGITGSIGSGKSYAMDKFRKICKYKNKKAIFIDVDDVRRKILLQENIDRDKLNDKIYSNNIAMKNYKNYINPKIKSYLMEQIKNNEGFILIEWALLIEDDLCDIVDSIIMIYCDKTIQIQRLENGDLGKKEIIKRMSLQLTNKQKIKRIKQLNKEYYILDTSDNPSLEKYEIILGKEGL